MSQSSLVRIAAVADTHLRPAIAGTFRPALVGLREQADLLLLAGDLTNGGTLREVEILGHEVAGIPVPVVAVLGNHDHDEGYGDQVRSTLEHAGVRVLEGDAVTIDVADVRVGIAGVMGGAGGFPDAGAYPPVDDGNPEHQERIRRGPQEADRLWQALTALDCDLRIALMHFAPVPDTLVGEPPEIYPGLGTHLLGDAVDRAPPIWPSTVTPTPEASSGVRRVARRSATSRIRSCVAPAPRTSWRVRPVKRDGG